MYRPVLGRMVIVHFNNKLIAYVNTGIDPGTASRTRSATQSAKRSLQPITRLCDPRL
jgi:hypothetical protein